MATTIQEDMIMSDARKTVLVAGATGRAGRCIVNELLKRGYSEEDIKKILSGNFIRVWNDVIEIADSMIYRGL